MLFFYAALLAAGLVGGLLAGLLGIGGGIFFLLVLPDALKYLGVINDDLAATVVANSLLGTLVSALAACVQHIRQNTPGRVDIAWVGVAAAVTAYLSLTLVVSQPWFNEQVFNGVVVVVLGALFGRTAYTYIKQGKASDDEQGMSFAQPARYKLITTGTLAGLVSSLTGLGGGILIVPMLKDWVGYPIRPTSFVSSGAIVLSSLAALYFSLTSFPSMPIAGSWGYIVPSVALPLIGGVVLAAPFGVRLAVRLSARTLTLIYLIFVALVLIRRGVGLLA